MIADIQHTLDRLADLFPPKRPSTAAREPDRRSGSVGQTLTPAEERAKAYLAKCDPAVSGQNGSGTTYRVARAVVWGFDLGAEAGFSLLWENYNPSCDPPWSERELRHKCEDADTKPFDKPRGYLLGESDPPGVRAGGETHTSGGRPTPPPTDARSVYGRIAAYLQACPACTSDRWRQANLTQACVAATWGFELGVEAALGLIGEYFAKRCKPRLKDGELKREVRRVAAGPHERPKGWLLGSHDPLREFPPKRMPQPVSAGSDPIDRADNPHRLAEGFIGAQPGRLRYWQSQFVEYQDGAYRVLPDDDLRARLTGWLRAEFVRVGGVELAGWRAAGQDGKGGPPTVRGVTQRVVSDTLNAVRSLALLPSDVAPPAWVDGASGPDPRDVLVVRNGLLDLSTRTLHRQNPAFFTLNALAFDYAPDAPRPIEWERFLVSLWGDDNPKEADADSLSAIQEWFGYLITADTSLQKALMIIGPKRGGKGTIARVLRALVGERNYTAPTLHGLAGEFGLAPLLGRGVAVISDARLSGRTDNAVVAERLLTVTGEDSVSVNRKFLPAVETRLGTRFVIMSNELPRLGDSSGALTGRLIVLRLTRSFFGREDRTLADRLTAELSGVLLWALDGLDRLRDRGRFQQPISGAELVEDLDELSSPVGAFVQDRCVLGADKRASVADLFTAWKAWCEQHGREHAGTEQSFGRDLRAAVPSLKSRRPQLPGGERLREYVGIGVRYPANEARFGKTAAVCGREDG